MLCVSERQTGIEAVISVGPVDGGPTRIGVPDSRALANKRGIGRFGPFEVDAVDGQIPKAEWHCDTGNVIRRLITDNRYRSSIRSFINFRIRTAGNGLLAEKRIVPLLVS